MIERIPESMPEVSALPRAYELAGQAYLDNDIRIELYRLTGGKERDSLKYLLDLALNGVHSTDPVTQPEYKVYFIEAYAIGQEVWEVTAARDLEGWFTPSQNKVFSLKHTLDTPDTRTGKLAEYGELVWTDQNKILLLNGRGYFKLDNEPIRYRDIA